MNTVEKRVVGETVAIAHSGTELGNVDPRFGDIDEVRANRATLTSSVPFLDALYVLKCNGGTDFTDVDDYTGGTVEPSKDFEGYEVTGDAVITRRPCTGLMLNAADCIPLVVAEPDKSILSLIHIGWRGAVFGLHDSVLTYAKEQHGFRTREAVAYLGPSIQAQSYLAEGLHPIQEQNPDWDPHITEVDDGFAIDIPGFVVASLEQQGIRPENIHISPVDTGADGSKHFSFTRHKNHGEPNGRNGFVATLI